MAKTTAVFAGRSGRWVVEGTVWPACYGSVERGEPPYPAEAEPAMAWRAGEAVGVTALLAAETAAGADEEAVWDALCAALLAADRFPLDD